jgi:3-phosphoshikimate 1-carboxyvinyltransferase
MTSLRDPLPIVPLRTPFDLAIRPPGSKSLTCRAYVLAALANGTSQILGPLRAQDTDALLDALCTLGTKVTWTGDDVTIVGNGGRFPRGGTINLGDGGTPTRFMIAAACLGTEAVIVDGSDRMRQRPIAEGVELLRRLGAQIEFIEHNEHLPVRITPCELTGGELDVGRTLSSQFISAVMLIAPCLDTPLQLNLGPDVTSVSYVELTRKVLREWRGGDDGPLNAMTYRVEPDASAATYWLAAAAMFPGAAVRIDGLTASSAQADTRFVELLTEAGAEPTGDDPVGIRYDRPLGGLTCDMSDMPDASLTLAAAMAIAKGPTTITGLQTLRIKETDRLEALATELAKIGCQTEITDDSITIRPTAGHADPVIFETYRDHRMAMALALIGLVRPGISIENPACVSKSYPTFWRDFARLYD